MTPVGGIGINYAIQDLVATANILTAIEKGVVPVEDLKRVQKRRERPTRIGSLQTVKKI